MLSKFEIRGIVQTALILMTATAALYGQAGDRSDSPGTVQKMRVPSDLIPPAPALSPQEEMKTFNLPPGLRIELVASEPLVKAPVAMEFDADGRMWVVEMIGYMPNVEGVGEDQPVGDVVILEDTNRDGVMDKRSVFVDHLVLPRAIGLVADGALIAEPPNLFFYRDADGDGKAEEKTLVDDDYGNRLNPEHGSNGLLWAMDNWIYSAKHSMRYRYKNGEWLKEETIQRGQWGITQDNYGRLYYNTNPDQLRVDLVPAHYFRRNPNFRETPGLNYQTSDAQEVWPARVNPGVNRGYQPNFLRPGEWTLSQYTAACAPCIYRGNLLPSEFQGNAFVAEPGGNLVRRNLLCERQGAISAANAYFHTEFLTSTDERFRPVNIYNGPDGALYILDMYRGIIQHRLFVTTYLRKQIEERDLGEPTDKGRIYRIVHESSVGDAFPKLSKASSSRLVLQLDHANGWWRDTAQRMLVERQDNSVVPALQQMAATGRNPTSRLHALWTLEGLGAIDEPLILTALKDWHPQVRVAAVRLSERLLSSDATDRIHQALFSLKEDPTFVVRWQLMFTLGEMKSPEAVATMISLLEASGYHEFLRAAAISGLNGRELDFIQALARNPAWDQEEAGKTALLQELAGCLLNGRDSDALNKLFGFAATMQASKDWFSLALLKGATPEDASRRGRRRRPLRLDSEPSALLAMAAGANFDIADQAQMIADRSTWPGKGDEEEPRESVSLTDEQQQMFEEGKKLFSVTCAACHQLHGNGMEGLAPPLAGSEWANGSVDRIIRIVLHGLNGPITVEGKQYNLVMPGLPVFNDQQIASILTYVRNEWENSASPVQPEKVREVREATQGRQDMWTEQELLKIP